MACIASIAIKPRKRGLMQVVPEAVVTVNAGITGDCRGRGGIHQNRQLTVVLEAQWMEACREVGMELPWVLRRANILICGGFRFEPSDVGRKIYLGSNVVLFITGETKPCNRMDEAYRGLQAALTPLWRAGVTCRVLEGGAIRLHDSAIVM